MEKKRYQVFVSSTYIDLKDERAAVFDTLAKIDCIPAGMEAFPAFDEEQLSYIKAIIDDSDYYVLIVGGRYGSITTDGVSFTEKEYDYAASRNIPILSFIHAHPERIAVGLTEIDAQKRARLDSFITKAREGRLVREWSDINELSLRVTQALTHSMKAKPGVGWIRGSAAASLEILNEINELRKKNAELIERIRVAESQKPEIQIDTAQLDNVFNIDFIINGGFSQFRFTWKELLSILGPSAIVAQSSVVIRGCLVKYIKDKKNISVQTAVEIAQQDFDIIKIHFEAIGYWKVVTHFYPNSGRRGEDIELTELGKRALFEIVSIMIDQKAGA